ncbi:MAG: hypothetical protein UW34_C0001G0043 [Parcubacteria group bacterium GW2011_GWA2_44_15]|nr:MAG: hypothetical protein UW34_C0001G0043 [Parcubacteria group bacterium GW2011_GWA2_44_15]
MNNFLKKTVLGLIAGVILLAPFGGGANLFAQVFDTLSPPPETLLGDIGDYAEEFPGQGFPGGEVTTDTGETVTQGTNTQGGQAAATDSKGAPQETAPGQLCLTGFGRGGDIIPRLNIEACAAFVMYDIIMRLVSWILFFAGLIFDASMYFTIHLSDLMQKVPVVDIGWKIFRDLANIFFIFILLWVAIGTILNLVSGKTKEMVINLIVVALLMNFSLFITKVVIDASNIVAVHFYELVPGSYSGAFMEGLKIQTFYDASSLGSADGRVTRAITGAVAGAGMGAPFIGAAIGFFTSGGDPVNMFKVILMGFFGSILMLTAAYVFFVASILFIIRIVVLMMVMLLSPLGFLAFALPATEKYAELWKEKLIGQSLFAPIYMALSYVVIRTIQTDAFQSVMTLRTNTGVGGVFAGATSGGWWEAASIIVNFLLLIGLMLGCILVAKKMEAVGVETAVEMGKAARGFVGRNIMRAKYVTAVGGAAGLIGSGAERLDFKDFGKKMKGFETGADKLQKKMDINELDKKFQQSKFGATGIGSFIREKTTGGALFGTQAKFGGEKSAKQAYDEDEKLKSRRFALEKVGLAEKSLEDLRAAKATGDKDAIRKAESLVSSNLTQVTPEDFANLDERKIEALARYANLKQLKAVLASEHWTEPEKRQMIGHRWKDETEEYKEYQKKVDNYQEKQKILRAAMKTGDLEIGADGNVAEFRKDGSVQTKVDADGIRRARHATDATKVFEAPKEKPPLPSNLKAWARNKMTLPEYEMAASVAPEMFDIKELVHTMRWGLTNKEIRTNENFSFDLRDRLTYDKDSDLNKIVEDARDPEYIKGDNELDADKAEAALRASKPGATEEEIKELREKVLIDSSTRKAAFAAGVAAAQKAEDDLLASSAPTTDKDIEEARNKAFKESYAKVAVNDTIRQNIAVNWKAGRAPNEVAGARGRNRNSSAVHGLIDEGIVQHYREKDSEDITALLEDVLKSFKAEENQSGLVSDDNRRLIKYLFTDPRSKTIPRPIETLSPDLKELYQRLEREGEKTRKIVFKSDASRLMP